MVVLAEVKGLGSFLFRVAFAEKVLLEEKRSVCRVGFNEREVIGILPA